MFFMSFIVRKECNDQYFEKKNDPTLALVVEFGLFVFLCSMNIYNLYLSK